MGRYVSVNDCDIAVLGGGGAGLVAAVRAAELSGGRVIVLEKANFTGGGMLFASAMRTFRSKWQKERGLPDVMDEFIRKAMDDTYWRLDPRLVANTFRATGEFFDWFCGLEEGIADEFETGFYIFDGPEGPQVPLLKGSGEHHGAGKFIMDKMLERCAALGIEVLTGHRVSDMETENGKITAVIAETEQGSVKVSCRAVILATGSWINNREIIEKYFPKFAAVKMDPSAHMNPNYTGDGIAIAEKAGAYIDYDSFVLRLMGPMCMCRSMCAMNMSNSPYSISVNLDGRRFVCEPSQVRMGLFNSGLVTLDQPEGRAFSVFAMPALERAAEESRQPHEGYGGFFGWPQYPDSMDEILADLDLGVGESAVLRADSIEELAEKMGVPADSFAETIAEYNANCDEGTDWGFHKPAEQLVKLDRGPYFAVKAALGTDGAFGGVLVDPDMQAYSAAGGLVEGFYAAGDLASGRHINLDGVKVQVINDMSWALASGFMAARSAAEYIKD